MLSYCICCMEVSPCEFEAEKDPSMRREKGNEDGVLDGEEITTR